MDDWFDHLVKDVIWQGLQDWSGDLKTKSSGAIHDELKKLKPGDTLSGSPLVAVIAKSESDDTVTLLIRGRFRVFGGSVAPFMRLQVVVSRKVDKSLDPPITITAWQTVVGDLAIKKDGVFTAELAFGWDQGAWLGRGAFKVLPPGFGLDLLLGGLDERGLMVGIDTDLPSPIPLGNGMVLTGVGGEFAYNFIPRLNKGQWQATPWNATDYVAWAKDDEDAGPDRWVQGAPELSAVGIGLHADFGDLPTMGWLLKLQPIGLAVLTPGPVFILGGKGTLLNAGDAIKLQGYVAVDIPSSSMALGLDFHGLEPEKGDFKFLDVHGSLDGFFSFDRPADWYLRLGTRTSPVSAKVLKGLDADLFLMVGHGAMPSPDGGNDVGVFMGLGIAYGEEWKVSIVYVVAKIGARAALGVGWDPLEVGGSFGIYGELGLKVWGLGLKVVL